MDFSSLNPTTSNSLNIAARNNNVELLRSLLEKKNPNCIDNRGWTCLHEAAAHDSYESLLLILQHPLCRPLAETHEGHTALYVACVQNASPRIILGLLENVPDIANYGSTECVSPLHIVCAQGNTEILQLLIEHGAMMDVQDFDNDTPLHDAAIAMHYECISILLHAGADSEITNDGLYTPFHLACYKGCMKTFLTLFPFVSDINQLTIKGDTALILAAQGGHLKIVKFLLKHGANPDIQNEDSFTALDMALNIGHSKIFITLLAVTNIKKIHRNLVYQACKPHYFKFDILQALLSHDLGLEIFDFVDTFHIQFEDYGTIKVPMYTLNSPLNIFLNVCEYIYNRSPESLTTLFYLVLMRGASVNSTSKDECPPIIYLHYCPHDSCFEKVFEILIEQGCNVDYYYWAAKDDQSLNVPDVFITSLGCDARTSLVMLPYSLYCDPDRLLIIADDHNVLSRIPLYVQSQLMRLIDESYETIPAERLRYSVSPLKHLSRRRVRANLRSAGVKTTTHFLNALEKLVIPKILKMYLRYK